MDVVSPGDGREDDVVERSEDTTGKNRAGSVACVVAVVLDTPPGDGDEETEQELR